MMKHKKGALTGKVLGKYELGPLLGKGAFGEVYLAHALENREWVRAVKVLAVGQRGYEDAKRRFKLEASLCRDWIHPNVILVHEPPQEEGGYLYLVMEYADGGSLRDLIAKAQQKGKPIAVEEVRRIAIQLVAGLKAIHEHPAKLVHRDICPENILLKGRNKQVLISDLGVAQTRNDFTRRTELGSLAPPHPGHPAYMSPQQRNDRAPVKPSDDLFSVGCVLFELLTLKPYQGAEVELDPHPGKYRKGIPPWLDEVVARCLAPERRDRFQVVEDLLVSLQQGRVIRRTAEKMVPTVPDIPPGPEVLRNIPPYILAEGVVLEIPQDLATQAEKAWDDVLDDIFEERHGLLDWMEKDVLEAVRQDRPVRKKMEAMIAALKKAHESLGRESDRIQRSAALVNFLKQFDAFRPPEVKAPKAVDFGTLDVGATGESTLRVTNTGGGVLELRLRSEHPALEVEGAEQIYRLRSMEEREVPIRFTPGESFLTEMPELHLRLESNVGEQDIVVVYAIRKPVLEVRPRRGLNFGKVAVGERVTRTLRVKNAGGSMLKGQVKSAHAAIHLENDGMFSCEAGEEVKVRVTLVPTAPFATRGALPALQIESNGGNQTVRVVAEVRLPPILSVHPERLDFGEVRDGKTYWRTVKVENQGDGVLRGRVISNHPALQIEDEAEFVCAAGEEVKVRVAFTPDETFQDTAPRLSLCVESNGEKREIMLVYAIHKPVLDVPSIHGLGFGEEATVGQKPPRGLLTVVGLLVLLSVIVGGALREQRQKADVASAPASVSTLPTTSTLPITPIPIPPIPTVSFSIPITPLPTISIPTISMRTLLTSLTPTLTPNPFKEPALIGTPYSIPTAPITAANAQQVIPLARWGKCPVYEVAWSPDGHLLAVASSKGIYLNKVETLDTANFLKTSLWVSSVAFSPDEQLLASASGAGAWGTRQKVQIWGVASGEILRSLDEASRGGGLVFLPDGQLLAVANFPYTGEIQLWQVTDGIRLRTLRTDLIEVTSIAVSPDGAFLAGGGSSFTVELWLVNSGTRVCTLMGHGDRVSSVAFSPDGLLLASGSWDNKVRLWQVGDGTLIHTLEGHEDDVESVTFSPDGSLVASGSDDGTVRLWRVSDGKLLRTLEGHTNAVLSVSFSPDGKLLASGSRDNTVRLWGVKP